MTEAELKRIEKDYPWDPPRELVAEVRRLQVALIKASILLRRPKHPTNRAESALAVIDSALESR